MLVLVKEIGKAKAKVLSPLGYEPPYILEPEDNGEYRFLRWLSKLPEAARFDAVIDVGANHGEWTEAARAALRSPAIRKFHCVEPIPWLAGAIRERFASEEDVVVAEVALSDVTGGETTIYNSGGGGSMYHTNRNTDSAGAKPEKVYAQFKVPLKTGDELYPFPSIKPYLLKIDCDGHDYKVLAGFAQLLARRRTIVQFEYCDFWIRSNTRLKEACTLLHGLGYRTYKMFPDRLVRFRYNSLFETFGYQNIVAAPAEMKSFSSSTLTF